MGIVFGGITPHPPIILSEIGGKETVKAQETVNGMERFAEVLQEKQPDVLIMITPHGVVFSDVLGVTKEPLLEGSFKNFGVPRLRYRRENDLGLVDSILQGSQAAGIPVAGMDEKFAHLYRVDISLDHGILVPLYFIDKAGINVPVVPVSIGMLPYEELYSFGMVLREAAERSGKRVAIIASGDMSHRLTKDAPAGYSPHGAVFDAKMQEAVHGKDVRMLLEMDRGVIEGAGECGLRPVIILFGALDGWDFASTVLSYQGPFGVGYMVATLLPTNQDPSRRFKEGLFAAREQKIRERREKESPFVALARKSLETYVKEGKRIGVPENLPPEMQDRAGVFVSLKMHGQLRGCIGTFLPTKENIAREIIENAIQAGTQDPRFSPVEEEELPQLTYSVDILSTPEPVKSLDELDPQRYGVIVRKGHLSGLLLPNLEGVDTVEEQLQITKRKAGISPNDDKVEIQRFEVKRYY